MKLTKKEARKIQILVAAKTVFVKNGFKGSTTLEIAKEAKISEVTLFRYFSTKRQIFSEVIEPILCTTLEELINFSNELNVEDKLESILYERISMISNNYETVRLILTEESLLTEMGNESFINRILQILKNMLSKTGVPAEDTEFSLRLLMGTILSFLYMPENNAKNIENYVEKVVAIILEKQKN